jgi:hypothetical protein
LVRLVATLPEKFKSVIHKRKVQEKTITRQTIATVADDLDSALRIIAIQSSKDLMMRQAIRLLGNKIIRRPCSDNGVIILGDTINIILDRSAVSNESPTSLLLIGTDSWT